MIKTLEKKVRMPKNRVSAKNYEVLTAEETNPKFDAKKPISEKNEHMPRFAVRFDFDNTGYVVCQGDYSSKEKGRDCYTALYTEADYLLDDILKPVWDKIELKDEVIENGSLPNGIDRYFKEALTMGNDTVLEQLGKHTKSYENIDFKVNYGIEDSFEGQLPYFTVTCTGIDKYGRCVIGGADHKEVERVFPEMKNLCHMHGRNILGEPLYAVENGWYFVSDEKLHDGFNEKNRRSTVAQYLDIPQELANHIVDSYQAGNLTKEAFSAIVDTQRPIWKQQAESVIQEYELEIRKDRPHNREELEEEMQKSKARKTVRTVSQTVNRANDMEM